MKDYIRLQVKINIDNSPCLGPPGLVPYKRGWLLEHSFQILNQKFTGISKYPTLPLITYYGFFLKMISIFNRSLFMKEYLL